MSDIEWPCSYRKPNPVPHGTMWEGQPADMWGSCLNISGCQGIMQQTYASNAVLD
eukprot:CAMPEP_0202901390 /NCGR_PEP_ID=MMETSP1392-20130828/14229_1 /ASSEMBLY_ACC=CAM_ASM_000868 /TAXON_ID=225041 /ORGANISM="Chlamydomonas chlamydogama, Strain SAG 11-48b" /LENGTH=54 /DNA_ID=CAMNT_0049587947 /DNA_START=246 /DNA_END=410 /DNA_ORIENTATION=-